MFNVTRMCRKSGPIISEFNTIKFHEIPKKFLKIQFVEFLGKFMELNSLITEPAENPKKANTIVLYFLQCFTHSDTGLN